MLPNELNKISSPEFQQYLHANESMDENKLLLAHKEVLGIPTSIMVNQIIGRRKSKIKLPTWYKTEKIIYPPTLNVEQTSSEATALFKTEIVKQILPSRNRIADLTGGFGVDSYFFSTIFQSVHHVEINKDLLEIATHNHQVLSATNIKHHNQSAEEFIKNLNTQLDFIYIDPSRRDINSKKIFLLADTTPNVVVLQSQFLEKADWILIKMSPLFDIQQGLAELINVEKIYVVSVANECKELLFLLHKDFTSEPIVEAVNLTTTGEVINSFSFLLSEERETKFIQGTRSEYLYEPNASILKSGAFKLIAKRFDIQKLHVSTHLYSSNKFITDFPGRVFKIESNFDQKMVSRLLPNGKANVLTRNYPMSAEALKKKLKLKDGGHKFVIGFTEGSKKTVVVASRVKQSQGQNKRS